MTAPHTERVDCFICDWRENRKFILESLDRIEGKIDGSLSDLKEIIERMDKRTQDLMHQADLRLQKNESEITKLSAKATVFGAIAGMIPMIVFGVWQVIRGNGK